ncbi:MAG: tRNA (adenosine(37)-N6)-threonylcarbamoyltransferase complex dimerization subunit type 1 TsaB [Bacteroidota bacterium]
MAIIIHIETSAEVCSVALSDNTDIIGEVHSLQPRSHASELAVLIDKILRNNKIGASSLSAVSVSKGPGSYTGLRIGVSTAKGLCYGAGLPLITIDTLLALANGGLQQLLTDHKPVKDGLLCPMLDARRMEVYAALYSSELNLIRPTDAVIITPESFKQELDEKKVYFFGPGAAKCKEIICHENACFLDGIEPSALNMVPFAVKAFKNKQFANLAYFEPFYLKDFVATKPKRKVL